MIYTKYNNLIVHLSLSLFATFCRNSATRVHPDKGKKKR